MILNQSTPEDAIRTLGQPSSDKLSRLTVFGIQGWLSKKTKEKVFRTLEFKKPEGIDKAWLSFMEGKLVAINLDIKKGIAPGGLSNIYGIESQPMVGAADVGFRPRDYERSQGRVYPRTYPMIYSMVAVSEKSFVEAMVGDVPSLGGALARSAGIPDQPGTFPGKVEVVDVG